MTAHATRTPNLLSRTGARTMRHLREQLATGEAPFEYALLGLVSGLLAGLVILLFRKTYETILSLTVPQLKPGEVEYLGFDALPQVLQFALPAVGGLLIGLVLWRVARQYSHVGVAHVVFYVNNRDGKLPWQNALVQFFGGIACLLSGQSVGREGPAVHLGVAGNSLLAQALHLPHNSLRVLAGCGTAAAIAASFNTPIAGIIFAMEVVLAEYTISGFIPVILASVTGTVVARLAYGSEPLITVSQSITPDLSELVLVILLAVLVSAASASFVRIQRYCLRFSDRPLWLRLGVAGVATGALALLTPQIMGVGQGTLIDLIATPLPLLVLCGIIVAKLLATALSIGLGMPGGMIGPNLFIGACIGTLLGQSMEILAPDLAGPVALYALLGMAAMMSAVLNAPLAALMTLMELTYNPHIIFPGLLAITVANICHRELFSQPSAIGAVLQHQGIDLHRDPVSQALQRIGVTSLMNTNVVMGRPVMPVAELRQIIARKPDWIILVESNSHYLVDTRALANHLDAYGDGEDTETEPEKLDMLAQELAAKISTIDTQANVNEAWQMMLMTGNEAVCVRSQRQFLLNSSIGVITRKSLETHIYRRYGATP
jgi:CIC family chloride channel protein